MSGLSISSREIQKAYQRLKGIAQGLIDEDNIEKAYDYIKSCVVLAQQFNWIYADDDLEDMEKQIANKLLPIPTLEYETKEDNVVLYDDFCLTYVLTIQYLEALLKMGKKILFVTARSNFNDSTNRFFSYIEQYKELEIVLVKEATASQAIKTLYERIIAFNPSKILLHAYANSIVIPVLYALPRQITSYLINLADQTFWLGARAIDYCIEFRPFGATVSMERRKLKRKQLLMLPFYPIKDGNLFMGFPKGVENRLIVFSGGDMYKTMDSKGTYWEVVKRLLIKYPSIVFLFATKVNSIGSRRIEQFIKDNHFEDRFFYIGFRPDIYEVMRHCDIYFGTFPASGSLMSQLAAINSKPILQYYYPGTPDDETEQALCINEKFQISYQDMNLFMQEAERLITDLNYRQKKGDRLRQAMIQPCQFEELLAKTLESNCTQFPVEKKDVDYALLERRWYDLENCDMMDTMTYISGLLGKKNCLRFVPSIYFKKQIMVLKNKIGK